MHTSNCFNVRYGYIFPAFDCQWLNYIVFNGSTCKVWTVEKIAFCEIAAKSVRTNNPRCVIVIVYFFCYDVLICQREHERAFKKETGALLTLNDECGNIRHQIQILHVTQWI